MNECCIMALVWRDVYWMDGSCDIYGTKRNEVNSMDRLISEQVVIDRLSHWYSDMLETGKEQEDLIEVIKAIPSAEPTDHAKMLKEFCRDKDNLDEPCEGCPFHLYDGFAGFCVFNYGLYPNEWFKPQERSENVT